LPDGTRLDITSFVGGELYVGGFGAIPEELPEMATSIGPQPSEIETMIHLTKSYLRPYPASELEILEAGRCYRPLANPDHPIITKVDWNLLSKDSSAASAEKLDLHPSTVVGGLFLNTAHFSDGLTLALGSGKVASELILGKKISVDISGLGLPTS